MFACGLTIFTGAENTFAADRLAQFITRQDDRLYEGTNEFRFLGLDAPALHQNENQLERNYSNRFPDEFEIEDTLASLEQIGARATRCFSISLDSPANDGVPVYVNGMRRYNEAAFRTFDKALELCHRHGVRVILPIIASQSFWGWRGVDEFAAMRGQPGTNFWTDPRLRAEFKEYLADLVNRTNTFTGVQYKNDPAILAWQLGNELMNYFWDRKLDDKSGAANLTAWSVEMAAYLKQIAPRQLVMEGGGNRAVYLADPNVDIISEHLYEYWRQRSNLPSDLAAVLREAWGEVKGRKPLIVDEFGMGDAHNLQALMDAIKETGCSGGLLWSIRPHRRDGGFFYHSENGSRWNAYHWPGFTFGLAYDESHMLTSLRREAFAIRGLPTPPLPPPTCAPVLFAVRPDGGLIWRGSTGAAIYQIERAPTVNGPWRLLADNVEDDPVSDAKDYENSHATALPAFYTDRAAKPGEVWCYRVKGKNDAGASPWSNIQCWRKP